MTSHIHTDELTRRLYANDASMYEELPAGVAFPQTDEDVMGLLSHARANARSLIARGAGTSLAGQTTGAGIVMDLSRYMNRALYLDTQQARACVQPGVIRDTLNRAVVAHGLHFAPDTSTTNRCTIGGMIGNNSAGLYSVKYGSTREHVRRIRAILADGSVAEFAPMPVSELERKQDAETVEGRLYRDMIALLKQQADLIRATYPHPSIIRRNTGYALDRLLEMEPFIPGGRPFNMAELLCGSEGTLAIVLEAEVCLTPLPRFRALVIPHFASLNKAIEATATAVRCGSAAVELVDDIVLGAALDNPEQKRNRFFLKGDPAALLIIELHGDDPDNVKSAAAALGAQLTSTQGAYAAPVIDDPGQIARVWDLRKAGLGLLMGVWSDKKTPEFMEDTAVRVEDLPAYIRDIQELMNRYQTRCVYYGHASVGELHLRPELNLGTPDGREIMERMATEVADLIKRRRGSLSGEHGDGRVRAPHLQRVFGQEMMAVLEEVKRIWDPDNLLNPGKIVRPEPMTAHLRMETDQTLADVNTVFQWRDQSGFVQALGRCNGAGVCLKLAESGGAMCPSYMATREEKDSTRGRANLFRQLFQGQRADAFVSDDLEAALDWCLSCKACKTECPANVDMARIKSAFLHGRHQQRGTTRSDRFFAYSETLLARAARWPRLVNFLNGMQPVKTLLKWLFNIDPRRTMPALADESFYTWFQKRPKPNAEGELVLILNDYYTNYLEPHLGKALVCVLEGLGRRVAVTPPMSSGRACLSLGLLDEAKITATRMVRELDARLGEVMAIIGTEPSELLTLRDEYLDLVDDTDLTAARAVADRAYLIEEYIAKHVENWSGMKRANGEPVYVHGHCHARSLTGLSALMTVLQQAGYCPVDVQSGCCGMAGSFGYTSDHYNLSMQIAEMRLFPALRALPKDALLCVHGLSCRHQILEGTGRRACHPAELLLPGTE